MVGCVAGIAILVIGYIFHEVLRYEEHRLKKIQKWMQDK